MTKTVLVRFGIRHGLGFFPNALIGKWRMNRSDFDKARINLDSFLFIVSALDAKAAKFAGMIVFEEA
jgi:hypothetical protein